MSRFVIDEWLWADLRGTNGPEPQKKSFLFLQEVFSRCDQLVTIKDSPFILKFYKLTKEAGIGDPRRNIVKVFKFQFLLNSEKLVLEQNPPVLPEKIRQAVKEEDKYLVQAYYGAQADALVTTDNQLIEALENQNPSINCQRRNDFLSSYMEGCQHN